MIKMINLDNIKVDIQNIAEAISSVLDIDVTIVDNNLTRIAGTGEYLYYIGKKVDNNSAFEESLTKQREFIIENPKTNKICNLCYGKQNCREVAEVCCPIICDGISYGVIGLIAFSKEQGIYIKNNRKNLMDFLNKMADLISSKLKEQNKSEELSIEKKKLETLLNNMDKAVVSTDIYGNVDKYNEKFKNMFKIKSSEEIKNILNLLFFINISDMNINNKHKSDSFVYTLKNYELKGVYNINSIIVNDELKGYVFDFIDKNAAINNFNQINRNYKISFDNIIGISYCMEKVKKEALIASHSMSTVLITGESGTGKELFARAIHNSSARSNEPFIAVNCAAIPDNLLESELFGYEEGAFTGARKGGKLGKFEIANKGTILLDEIGDMSLHLQAKLLRVLQERELNKLGAKDNTYIDVRIIAATNKNLEDMIQKGQFREDLYYRLNVIPINIPSLRERKEDISLLVKDMISIYSSKLNKRVYDIEDKALESIMNYSWPGNIRELQNIIEYSVNMSIDEIIKYENIPNKIKDSISKFENINNEDIIPIYELERIEIVKALNKYKDYKKDKERAAQALGLSKATLYRKLKEYKIVSK
jgi:transcriptional regulator with PAS, ATPase and Fis domain